MISATRVDPLISATRTQIHWQLRNPLRERRILPARAW
jgi:hypothetical protein